MGGIGRVSGNTSVFSRWPLWGFSAYSLLRLLRDDHGGRPVLDHRSLCASKRQGSDNTGYGSKTKCPYSAAIAFLGHQSSPVWLSLRWPVSFGVCVSSSKHALLGLPNSLFRYGCLITRRTVMQKHRWRISMRWPKLPPVTVFAHVRRARAEMRA